MVDLVELLSFLAWTGSLNLTHRSHISLASPAIQYDNLTTTVIGGTLLMIVGAAMRIISYRYLGRFFTFQLAIKNGHELITDGPYAVVRHPGYTGTTLIFPGIIIAQGAIWSTLGLWDMPAGIVFGIIELSLLVYINFVVVVVRVPKEDAMLREQFREKWDAWAQRTPWRVIPYVY
jgi:protein-S-isoprenylcysteine O-methyltransferase Ste14